MSKNEATASVFDLLKADHRKVEKLFAALEHAEGEEKVSLARAICIELSVHAEAEERAFYPAAREALDEEGDDLVKEAIVEHRTLKQLIADIDGSSPKQDLFEANLKVLEEYVKHHVKEEEDELFPKFEATDFDEIAIGEKLAGVKARLMKKVEDQPMRKGAQTVNVPALAGPAATKTKTKAAAKKKSGARRAA